MTKLIFISAIIFLTSCNKLKNTDKTNEKILIEKVQVVDTIQKAKIEKTEIKQPKIKSKNIEIFDCPDFNFQTARVQADSLLIFMNRAKTAELNVQLDWERKFFCAYPNSFKEMQNIFGYDDTKGEAPLYSDGFKFINFFSTLNSIHKKQYYAKYIDINIDGIWEADNIQGAFGFDTKLLEDIENISSTFENYS
ncbi:MAG: hypothetical protein JKZ03_02420, partial [Flavobacteriaceae bacterium]|nr:hypothetical protein [Flavobacteriaceae bacterium]